MNNISRHPRAGGDPVIKKIQSFQQIILDFYEQSKRDFAWRRDITPYKIFISEIMLQQTQTARVAIKFDTWMQKFPDFASVATASSHQIIAAWQGLGYNRRALAIHAGAQKIMQEFNGNLPQDPKVLQTFKGIGPNTAASICAFAFDMPVVFIETNIRTVFLHHFFANQTKVSDQLILKLVAQALPQNSAREWYYGLMDYGVHLKTNLKISNKASKHYSKQSKFIGSRRQVRGAIIKVLSATRTASYDDLLDLTMQEIGNMQHDFDRILQELIDENMVRFEHEIYKL